MYKKILNEDLCRAQACNPQKKLFLDLINEWEKCIRHINNNECLTYLQ